MDPILREAGPVLAGSGTRDRFLREAGSGQRAAGSILAGGCGAGGIPSGSVMSQVSAIGRPMVSAS